MALRCSAAKHANANMLRTSVVNAQTVQWSRHKKTLETKKRKTMTDFLVTEIFFFFLHLFPICL
jgi:hypothetical protein